MNLSNAERLLIFQCLVICTTPVEFQTISFRLLSHLLFQQQGISALRLVEPGADEVSLNWHK